MNSRELAYFVAVAEEANFSRAAARLGIAQPPLSRAIKQLENRLGVVLLKRNSREVSLTPAGAVLLDEGRKALSALAFAETLTRRTGQAGRQLKVVMKPAGDAGLLDSILDMYSKHPDAIEVESHVCGLGQELPLLREGAADVAFMRTPQADLSGLAHEELLREHEMAVVPSRHPLAHRASVEMADLAGEIQPRWSPQDSGPGPLISDTGQIAELIARGRMIAVVPESAARLLGYDLVTVPVVGRTTTLLAVWREDRRERALAAFVRACVEASAKAAVRGNNTGREPTFL
ncbi:LysR family transcriptional regulator [Streptomyces antimycoticus]|uniref:LysR family transcriptional regulator n=1 Tax=Streptomyces TaxID=1883 RepID=UPI0034207EA4